MFFTRTTKVEGIQIQFYGIDTDIICVGFVLIYQTYHLCISDLIFRGNIGGGGSEGRFFPHWLLPHGHS